MRKLMAAGLLMMPLGLGCSHVGGVCDCAPVPGDSYGHNPHVTYHATCPGGGCEKHGAITPTTAVSTDKDLDGFEPIAPPQKVEKVKEKIKG